MSSVMSSGVRDEVSNTINVAEQLKQSALFKSISTADLEALVRVMKRRLYPVGTVLFRKGDPGNAMFIILSGQVHIYTQDAEGREFTLTHYGPTRVFGDFSILDDAPRSASATASEPLEVLTLNREDFLAFLPSHPTIGLAMIRHLTDRLRYITIYLNRVTAFSQWLSEGDYERAIQELADPNTGDEEIDTLIVTFMQMAHNAKDRTKNLAPPAAP
jgi:CRP/FNR family transcriptional regulator, cyclic AMP receptor protein